MIDNLKKHFSDDSWNLLKHTLKYQGNIKPIKQNRNLDEFYKTLIDTYLKISNMALPTSFKKYNVKKNYKDNKYFYNPHQKDFFKNDLEIIEINTRYSHYTLKIRFIKKKKTKLSNNIIKRIISKCFTLMYLFADHGNLDISFYLTDFKKTYECEFENPEKTGHIRNECVLGVKNVNTGSTTTYYDTLKPKEIDIWRCEELEKVLVHEIIHALKLDNMNLSKFDNYIQKQTGLPEKSNSNEAYTEIWARILNCMFVSADISEKQNNTLFWKLLHFERIYSIISSIKILEYYGITNHKDLSKLQQNSHIFSYYLLAGCYIYHLDEFIQFCEKNKNEMLIKLRVGSNTLASIENLFDFVYTNGYLNDTKLLEKFKVTNPKLKNTLRMTIVEQSTICDNTF